MKKICLLLFFLLMAAGLQAQTSVFTADTLCVSPASPQLLLKGRELKVGCDSVYLISPARYRLYQQLHQHVLSLPAEGQYQPVLQVYDQALTDTQEAYEEILNHYRQTDQLSQQWAESSRLSLEKMLQSVQHAEQTLTAAHEELSETRKQMEKEKHRQRWTKMLIGAAGVGLGCLLAR